MAYPFPITHPRFPKTLDEWRAVNPIVFHPKSLHPTQYVIRIDRLLALASGHPPELDDMPHVVTHRGKTYLYDGHHRWALAMIAGKVEMLVRNVYL